LVFHAQEQADLSIDERNGWRAPFDLGRAHDCASFEAAKAVVRAWLIQGNGEAHGTDVLMDELWTVLHGMGTLYLDRSAPIEREQVGSIAQGRCRDTAADRARGNHSDQCRIAN